MFRSDHAFGSSSCPEPRFVRFAPAGAQAVKPTRSLQAQKLKSPTPSGRNNPQERTAVEPGTAARAAGFVTAAMQRRSSAALAIRGPAPLCGTTLAKPRFRLARPRRTTGSPQSLLLL